MADPENASKWNHDWTCSSVVFYLLLRLEFDWPPIENQQRPIEGAIMDLLEEENVRLRLVNLVMFPSETLQNSVSARALLNPHFSGSIYLSDAKASPFFLPQ